MENKIRLFLETKGRIANATEKLREYKEANHEVIKAIAMFLEDSMEVSLKGFAEAVAASHYSEINQVGDDKKFRIKAFWLTGATQKEKEFEVMRITSKEQQNRSSQAIFFDLWGRFAYKNGTYSSFREYDFVIFENKLLSAERYLTIMEKRNMRRDYAEKSNQHQITQEDTQETV